MKFITAKQLAEALLKNPDDIVCVRSSNFEHGNADIPLDSLRIPRYEGNIVNETFRDAFDGGSYNKDVVRYTGPVTENSTLNMKFVKL